MEYRIIKSPTQGIIGMLRRRKGPGASKTMNYPGAIGLIQDRMIGMVCAADMAEKAVGVMVEDTRGSCPQNTTLLIIFGDMVSVEAALDEIRRKEKEGEKEW